MIAIIFSIFCFGISVYQLFNGASDVGVIICMVSSIIWYLLYLVNLHFSGNLNIKKAIVGSKIINEKGVKDEY